MGTGHLTMVQIGGVLRLAQYGQWDGHPDGAGANIVAFLQQGGPEAVAKLQSQLTTAAKVVTDEEHLELLKAEGVVPDEHGMVPWDGMKAFGKKYPRMTRDLGAKVLQYVVDTPVPLIDAPSDDFAGDSLFCEFAYLLDLDTQTLEFYKGFNKEPLPPAARFARLGGPNTDGYYPVALALSLPFDTIYVTPLGDVVGLMDAAAKDEEDEDEDEDEEDEDAA